MSGQRQFQWHWLALLVTLAVAAAGVRLSLWQLQRAEAKQTYLEQIRSRADQAPVALATLLTQQDPGHYPVQLRGHFDNQHPILLDNRILDGVAGYHLLSPFQTDAGQWLLINRGWLPRGRDRDVLPTIPVLEDDQHVFGHSYRYSDQTFTLAADDMQSVHWPLRLQKVEMRAIGEVLGVDLAPFEIRVDPAFVLESGEQLPRPWQDATEGVFGPERHRAYALQWFALAVLAVVVFIAASFRTTHSGRESTP